jgi:16S rRNA (uracil1498-N3)-methyltransferase
MTRRRWIADQVQKNTAILTGEHAAHLTRVLRAQIGQEFDIATGEKVRLGKIISIAPDRVEFSLGEEVVTKPSPNLTLVLAIFKFDRMEWAIEKCTEIGVTKIIPVIARRTDSHLAVAAGKRRERWQRLARQAAEQSRRAAPPEIMVPTRLKELGSAGVSPLTPPAKDNRSTHIILTETETDAALRDVLSPSAAEIVLAAGPEGGWTEDELTWFRESGWMSASLGDTILRAETAAIVATALVLDILR